MIHGQPKIFIQPYYNSQYYYFNIFSYHLITIVPFNIYLFLNPSHQGLYTTLRVVKLSFRTLRNDSLTTPRVVYNLDVMMDLEINIYIIKDKFGIK